MLRKAMLTICFVIGLPIVLAVVTIGARGCQWAGGAVDVVANEVDPAYLLKKYEWFKDAAAQLDKKKADIGVYQSRLTEMEKSYEGVPRKDWDRVDKQQMMMWRSEVAGVTASYNGLAAEYNAQMAKINWRFCNVGQLPQGATDPLPREYAPYL